MPGLDGIGRALILIGITLLVVGAVFVVAPRIPFLGRLPGDITIQRDGVTIYIPLATMALISIIASIVIGIASRR